MFFLYIITQHCRKDADAISIYRLPFYYFVKNYYKTINCISNIRNKAKTLWTQGKAILEKAKREVERMIIGE